MEVRAIAKDIRISSRKCRLTMDLVRGKSVLEAEVILDNLNNNGARYIKKVLDSAVANAVNNNKLDKNKLFISKAYVNDAKFLKRMKPGPRGRIYPIIKKSSHITVVISERN